MSVPTLTLTRAYSAAGWVEQVSGTALDGVPGGSLAGKELYLSAWLHSDNPIITPALEDLWVYYDDPVQTLFRAQGADFAAGTHLNTEGTMLGLTNLIYSVDYIYTGAEQQVTLSAGTYLLECWGGRGMRGFPAALGGLGGYARGTLVLAEETLLRLYVGRGGAQTRTGGWPDGGLGGDFYAGGGGGSSSIRIGGATNAHRVLVAGGGGGSHDPVGGVGGGLYGGNGSSGTGGTQIAGGVSGGAFGQGGNGYSNRGGAGGGGWYGGGGAITSYASGGGGSAYIGDPLEVEGESFPKVPILDGYTQSGVRAGNGLIRITDITDPPEVPGWGRWISTPIDLSAFGSNPPFSISWSGTVPGGTSMRVFAVVVASGTGAPARTTEQQTLALGDRLLSGFYLLGILGDMETLTPISTAAEIQAALELVFGGGTVQVEEF